MYITDAIILKKEPLGEADFLVTVLTPRWAKIHIVVQGVRKAGAKLKGHIEPLSLSRLSFVIGKNNYRLVGAELLSFFPTIKNDPVRLRTASEVIRLIDDSVLEDRSGINNFFPAASDALFFLDEPERDINEFNQALSRFKEQFLHEYGLLA